MKRVLINAPYGRRFASAALCAILAFSLTCGAFAAETDMGVTVADDPASNAALTQTVSDPVSLTADGTNDGIGISVLANCNPVAVTVTGEVDVTSAAEATGVCAVAMPGGELDLKLNSGVRASAADAAYAVLLQTDNDMHNAYYYESGSDRVRLTLYDDGAYPVLISCSGVDVTADYGAPRVLFAAREPGFYDLYFLNDGIDVTAWSKGPVPAADFDVFYTPIMDGGEHPEITVTMCTAEDAEGTALTLQLPQGNIGGPAIFRDAAGNHFLITDGTTMQARRIVPDNSGETITCIQYPAPELNAELGGAFSSADAVETAVLDLKAYQGSVAVTLEPGTQLTSTGSDYAWGILADSTHLLRLQGRDVLITASDEGSGGANSSVVGLYLRVVTAGAISGTTPPSELRLTGNNRIEVSAAGRPQAKDYSAGILSNAGIRGESIVYFEGDIAASGVGMVGVEVISMLGGHPDVTVIGDVTLTGSDSDGLYIKVPKPMLSYQPAGEVYVRGNVALADVLGDDAGGISANGGTVILDGDLSVDGESDQLIGVYADQNATVLVTGTITAPIAVLIPSDLSEYNKNNSRVYVREASDSFRGKTEQIGYVLSVEDGLNAELSCGSENFVRLEKDGRVYCGAFAGDTVTVTADTAVAVVSARGEDISLTEVEGGYAFEVPADCGVTVTEKKADDTEGTEDTGESFESGEHSTASLNRGGSVTQTTFYSDGSEDESTTLPDGTVAEKKTDADGNTIGISVSLSKEAISAAAEKGRPVTLPITAEAANGSKRAAPIEIVLPEPGKPVTVEIPVGDLTDGTVAVIVREDGSEELVKTSVNSEKGVVMTVTGKATVRIADNTKTYGDVDAGAWYADEAAWVSSRGIMTGTNKGFEPDLTANRAMAAQLLFNLDGAEASGRLAAFSDVSDDDWFADCVTWAAENGIVRGKGESFDPNGPVTREQFAVMLYNYAKYRGLDISAEGELSAFSDAGDVSAWAKTAVRWAVGAGLINGMGDGTVAPQGSATRAQLAALMQRFCAFALKSALPVSAG